MRKEKLTAAASVVSAIAASACCVGPLLAASLGVGSLGAASGFQRWRPFFLAVMFALLAVAWYLASRKPKSNACREGAACKPAVKGSRAMILVATLVAVGVAVLPNYIGAIVRIVPAPNASLARTKGANLATLKLSIEGMQCAACAANIQRQLMNTEAVVDAEVVFKTQSGVIKYDRARISPDKIMRIISQAGFKARQFAQKKMP